MKAKLMQAWVLLLLVAYTCATTLIFVFDYLWGLATLRSAGLRRYFASLWMTKWSAKLHELVGMGVLEIDTVFEPGFENLKASLERPLLVVANHQSTADVSLIAYLLWKIGIRNARWVVKRMLFLVFWALWFAGCAGLARNRSRRDIRRLQKMADLARHDGASIVLFPEGTRFREDKQRNGFVRVLEPSGAGYAYLSKAFPDYEVLWLAIDWQVRPVPRSMLSLHSLKRRRVVVHWHLEPATGQISSKERKRRLELKWRELDALLVKTSSSLQ